MVCTAFWFGEVRVLILAFNLTNRVFAGAIIPLEFFPEKPIEHNSYDSITFFSKYSSKYCIR